MNSITIIVLVSVAALAQASLIRSRRDDRVERYCIKHEDHYNKYCNNKGQDLSNGNFAKLAKFCPAYEKHCMSGAAKAVDASSLVMPPPLPKGGDFALLDLPLSQEGKHSAPAPAQSSTRLTAAIIASCTPDCTAAHCTDECKCANTHPKVHQMCNPPSSAAMAQTCQKWYSKCTMFSPVQYY